MHFLAFGLDLAALIVGVTTTPFTDECVGSSSTGCQILKSAIAISGVLMYLSQREEANRRVLFLLSSLIILSFFYGGARVQRRSRKGMDYANR